MTTQTIEPLTSDDPVSFGEYRSVGRLGVGGMGVVYLGQAQDGRQVAIKVIRREFAADPAYRARFETEVANARRVASFCTAAVLAYGDQDGQPYLVTEFVQGMSLKEYVEAHGPFPAAQLRGLVIGIGTALLAIHTARLVHRDLKPHNVLLAQDGPRVIDFGIARATDAVSQHTATGVVVGSPGWIPPEQFFEGQVSTAGDIFAWGTLVAYAATGRHPYGTGNMMVLAVRAQQGAHDLSGVPSDLLPLVEAALHPDPSRRPTGEQLLTALIGGGGEQQAQTQISSVWTPGFLPAPRLTAPGVPYQQTSPAASPSYPPPSLPAPPKKKLVPVAASVAVAALLGVGGFFASDLLEKDDPQGQGDPAPATSTPQGGDSLKVPDAAVSALQAAVPTIEQLYSYDYRKPATFKDTDLPVAPEFLTQWTSLNWPAGLAEVKQDKRAGILKIAAAGVISSSDDRIETLVVGERKTAASYGPGSESVEARVRLTRDGEAWQVAEIAPVDDDQEPVIDEAALWPAVEGKTMVEAASACLTKFLDLTYEEKEIHKSNTRPCLSDQALTKDLPAWQSQVARDTTFHGTVIDAATQTYPTPTEKVLLLSTKSAKQRTSGGDQTTYALVWRMTLDQPGGTWRATKIERLSKFE